MTATMPMPMLADFAIRLACGLAAGLLLTPWRAVPPAFFRTHCTVMLGLLALAALDLGWEGAGHWRLGATAGAAALAYVGAVGWGLGLARVGRPATAALLLVGCGLLVASSRAASPWLWALNAAGRLASAALLGSTLTAMLLGHHYLTAPAMSIDPLSRHVRATAGALAVRAAIAAAGPALWMAGWVAFSGGLSWLFLAMRWGMGIVGPALATYLAWQTVRIRSTQSATGILYIAMTLVLFGELTALILSRDAGVVF